MRYRCLCFLLIVASIAGALPPDTTLSGGSVQGVWGPPYQHFFIEGDLTVPASYFLTIMPGVQVLFEGYYGITVSGGLTAHGTPDDSVFFLYYGQPGGHWKSIKYLTTVWGDSALLRYCHFSQGERAVQTENQRVYIEHCLIHNCLLSPIYAQDFSGAETIFVTSSQISNNGGSGVTLFNANAQITNCEITYSGGEWGDGVHATGGGTVTINGGLIGYNEGAGIFGSQLDGIIVQNVEIAHNLDAQSGKGINLTLCTELTISRVSIHDNGSHGLFLSSTHAEGRNLTITSNGGAGVYFSSFSGSHVLDIHSSIVDHNAQWGFYRQSGLSVLQYNDAYANYISQDTVNYSNCAPGSGSIELDPEYVNPDTFNFGLLTQSPCIDTGDPGDPLDPDNTRTDMGAYYFDQDTTGIWEPREGLAPVQYEILNAYPNPFNPTLTMQLNLTRPLWGSLRIWSVEGRFIKTLKAGWWSAGLHTFTWQAGELPSGLYLLRWESEEQQATLQRVLIK